MMLLSLCGGVGITGFSSPFQVLATVTAGHGKHAGQLGQSRQSIFLAEETFQISKSGFT